MKAYRKALAALLLLTLLGFGVFGQTQGEHIELSEEDLEWQAGPPSLPEGSEFVVLEGTPSEEGPLTLRLRFPADYEIPPHTHPAIEHVTVLSGSFNMGSGDSLDRDATNAYGPGGFMVMPVGHEHFAWTGEETVVQLHSIGPWGIDYLDPADDPRN